MLSTLAEKSGDSTHAIEDDSDTSTSTYSNVMALVVLGVLPVVFAMVLLMKVARVRVRKALDSA